MCNRVRSGYNGNFPVANNLALYYTFVARPFTMESGSIRKLETLLEVSQVLAGTPNLSAGLHKVLELLEKQQRVQMSLVVLGSATSTGQSELVARQSRNGFRQPIWQKWIEENLVKPVLKSGRSVAIPRASSEPLCRALFEQLGSGKVDFSFMCVPILVGERSAGAINAIYHFEADRNFERVVQFYHVLASMVAQFYKLNRRIEADRRKLVDENIHLRSELREKYDFSNIIGSSSPMRTVYEQVEQVARSNTTVLIRGESGTGKELIAHALHYNSLRSAKPFIKVNCAALPETLIESELFGYERGAFTGAVARKRGRFEAAQGGSLFLDEIGDFSPSLQLKLLRVLQEREFERLGGNEPIRADVRLIAATNKNLEQAIVNGTFREDLYYRLNVFAIFVPPLRDRKSDILLLADHFLEKFNRQLNKNIRRISTPAIDMLTSYHWPGNVRELENCMERAVLVCESNVVHGYHLPPSLQTAEVSGTVTQLSLGDAVNQYEKDLITDTLKSTRGNCAKAARRLQCTERIFNYKVKKYEIDSRRFRS